MRAESAQGYPLTPKMDAKALPKTYWGSVAKDRLRATRLNIGDEAIPIVGKTTSGASFSSTAMRGKPLVAMFYTASDFDTEPLLKLLKEQREKIKGVQAKQAAVNGELDKANSMLKRMGKWWNRI